jgi:hypothetical protein
MAGGSGVAQQVRLSEGASKTFNIGVPLIFASGVLTEATFGAADVIVGFSAEPGHNLTTAGTAQDGVSEGTAQNQPSSKIIPVGAWIRDGKCGVYAADDSTIFSAALLAGQVYADTLLVSGTFYGLTKDNTSGFWYVDPTDTSGNNAVVQLIGVDPSCPNTAADGSRVFFQIKPAARYFN